MHRVKVRAFWRATACVVLISLLTATAIPAPRVSGAPSPTAIQVMPTEPRTSGSIAPAASEDARRATPNDRDDDEDDRPEAEEADEPRVEERFHGGGSRNVVQVRNRHDGRLRVRGRIQLNHIPGPNAEPLNLAFAYGSCTDCQTFAVALQIDLISPYAQVVAPQNYAVALNYQCTRCRTVARALQYVYTIEDPDQVPDNADRLIRRMERELRDIAKDKRIGPDQAEARINVVIAEFQELAETLYDQRDEAVQETSPGALPPPTTSPAPDPAATPTVGPTASPAGTPTASPTAPTEAPAEGPTASPTATIGPTALTPQPNLPVEPSPTPALEVAPSPSATPAAWLGPSEQVIVAMRRLAAPAHPHVI